MIEALDNSNPPKKFRKGDLVKVSPDAFKDSQESFASDQDVAGYVFEGPGQLLAVKGLYAQIRWRRPVPDVWLRLDQLEEFK